ncbi:MAG: phosphatase PAP2 family protein [Flavobacteriales bacterium]|nr:phosphatase PAP2 family protein [Flavobacteriales bacterium]
MQGTKAINPFLLIWAVYTLLLGFAVVTTDHLDLHRAMHRFTSPWADGFFGRATHLADGLVPTGLALSLLLFKDVRAFLMMALSCGLSAIVVQVLKRYFDHDRPFMFKAELGDMHWVEGMELHHHLSFPSGHATAAFSMCYALAVLIGRRMWSLILALSASILAYSRVYLSQHFTEDILFGAALGTSTAVVVHWWLYHSPFKDRPWLQRRLFN